MTKPSKIGLGLFVAYLFLVIVTSIAYAQTAVDDIVFDKHGPMWAHSATATLSDGQEYVAVRMLDKAYLPERVRAAMEVDLALLDDQIKQGKFKQVDDK